MELKALLEDTENQKCFHCEVDKIEFVSINNAIYLCGDCACIHKKLGLFYSSIVPISKNFWQHDFDILLLGGNRQLKDFLAGFEFKKRRIKEIMTSKAADYYRRMIRATADNINFEEALPSCKEGIKATKKLGKIGRLFRKSKSSFYRPSGIASARATRCSDTTKTFARFSDSSPESVLSNLSPSYLDFESLRPHPDGDIEDYRKQAFRTLSPSTTYDLEGNLDMLNI